MIRLALLFSLKLAAGFDRCSTNGSRACLALFLGGALGLLVALLPGCRSSRLPEPFTAHQPGQVSQVADVFGTFYAYLPASLPAEAEVLVLVHGTPAGEQSAEDTARYYLESWIEFSEKNGLILLAPAFNQEDFSSREGNHAMGGYRALLGRVINADEWVLRLVQAHQQAFGVAGAPFYLYGHSAGGQFVARFLVAHPEHVRRAVITAAATYPQPDGAIPWPFGMGELHTDIAWDAQTTRRVDIVPDKDKWLQATQVPLVVIVGLNDTSELPAYPGQKGKNRFTIGQNWVRDMAGFAQDNGLESRFRFVMIPGKGHSMTGLIPYSQDALVSR